MDVPNGEVGSPGRLDGTHEAARNAGPGNDDRVEVQGIGELFGINVATDQDLALRRHLFDRASRKRGDIAREFLHRLDERIVGRRCRRHDRRRISLGREMNRQHE